MSYDYKSKGNDERDNKLNIMVLKIGERSSIDNRSGNGKVTF
jgi:hypothetical protein